MEDQENGPSLSEKRRRYFEARDKHYSDKKGFRKLDVDSLPKGPQFVMVLLSLLGAALVAFQLFGPALYQEEVDDITDTFPGNIDPAGQISDGVRLNPEPLRQFLGPLEEAFFNPPSADSFDSVVAEVGTQLDRFSDHLKASLQEQQQSLATELEAMAVETRQEGFDLQALDKLQQDWVRLRSRRFQPADWFLASSQAKLSPVAEYAVYRDVADQLLRHVGSGLTEAEDVIEEETTIGSTINDEPARAALSNRWLETIESWHRELDGLKQQIPDRPAPNAPSEVLTAVYRLESALKAGQSFLPTDRLPTNQDLESAESVLSAAQGALEAFDELQ